MIGLPESFVVTRPAPRTLLVARRTCIDALLGAGLGAAEGWERILREAGGTGGRGRTALLHLPGPATFRLKRMRRGGLARLLWRDRFAGTGRLLDNVTVACAARERGLATPAVAALLAVEGPPGLHRAWLAAEEIDGATDMAARQATRAEWTAVMTEVRRMHELGIEHRDLNLGNLLLRSTGAAAEAFVVDLDRARLWPAPLSFALRRRMLRRLERSCVKLHGAGATDWIYDAYAGADGILAQRLARGRRLARWRILLHRMAWRRQAARQ